MGTNKLIFDHVLLVSKRRVWRNGMARLHPIEKVKLERGFLARFQKAAVGRVRLALTERGRRALAHIDTTGKAAQKEAAGLRRMLVKEHGPGPAREAHGVELIERCICYNTGSLGEPFGRCQVGVVERENGSAGATITHHDLDSGESWDKTYIPGS